MKLFGNDNKRPHVSRNTADFAPISAEKADAVRAEARKKAAGARAEAQRVQGTYSEAKAAAKQNRSAAKQTAGGAKKPEGAPKGAHPDAKKSRAAARKAVIIASTVLAALVIAAAGFGVYVAGSSTIYPNVTLGGTELGGMTVAEAAEALKAAGWTNENELISVELPMEHSLTLTASEAGASVTAEQAAETAYAYCHEGNILSCLWRYLKCLVSGGSAAVEIDVDEAAVRSLVDAAVADIMSDLESSGVEVDEEDAVIRVVKGAESLGIDPEALTELICTALAARSYGELDYEPGESQGEELDVDSLYETVHREAADAAYDPETDEVTPSVTGVDFDKAEASRLWDAAEAGEVVEIPAEITEPEYTTEEYTELLFSTGFGEPVVTSLRGSSANRINNVQLAAAAINGVVLMPGEQFDYNECLGERTTERGYKAAGAYSDGQVVSEVGGGICQVSSGLYYAALLANLQIDTRTCHYFPVGYLPAGLDATVSWGGPEFRFTNNRDWPVRIEASVDTSANTVSITLRGTNLDGSYVVMESGVTGYVYGNEEYPETATGYKAQSYRCVYAADGSLISRTKEASSQYHYHEEDIVYPTPSPTPTPTPSEPAATEPPAQTDTPATAPPATEPPIEPTEPVQEPPFTP